MKHLLLLLVSVAACDFSASTKVSGEDSGGPLDSADPGGDGAGTDGGGDGGGSTTEPTDLDGDGWSEEEGDCADTDPAVHPEASDGCDGVDTDCDGVTDEDAASEDEYEPNDEEAWDLGSLDEEPGRTIQAAFHSDDDVDRYAFSFTDSGWGLFSLTAVLTGIPEDATYRLTIENKSRGEVVFEEVGTDSIHADYSDQAFQDDGGDWEIVVEPVVGADCARRYLLTLALD